MGGCSSKDRLSPSAHTRWIEEAHDQELEVQELRSHVTTMASHLSRVDSRMNEILDDLGSLVEYVARTQAQAQGTMKPTPQQQQHFHDQLSLPLPPQQSGWVSASRRTHSPFETVERQHSGWVSTNNMHMRTHTPMHMHTRTPNNTHTPFDAVRRHHPPRRMNQTVHEPTTFDMGRYAHDYIVGPRLRDPPSLRQAHDRQAQAPRKVQAQARVQARVQAHEPQGVQAQGVQAQGQVDASANAEAEAEEEAKARRAGLDASSHH
jgi:hypothetical protein